MSCLSSLYRLFRYSIFLVFFLVQLEISASRESCQLPESSSASQLNSTKCIQLKIAQKYSMEEVLIDNSVNIINYFIAQQSLSIVIGNCKILPLWLKIVQCNKDLHLYIYNKCRTTKREFLAEFPSNRFWCLRIVELNAPDYYGQQGTIKDFLFNNYHNLTKYTLFMKDNNRKSNGLTPLQRIASALLTIQKSAITVHFLTFSDAPPWSHNRLRIHNQKSRSVRASFPVRRQGEIQNCKLRRKKDTDVSRYCRMFERLTCKRCRIVWIPVRSQFIVSNEVVQGLDRNEFRVETSEHDEYTWALLFRCYARDLLQEKGRLVYPYFMCI